MGKLETLQKKLDQKRKEYKEIQAQIEDLRAQGKLPVLKNKYEGKYFKCVEKNITMFVHCVEVESEVWMKGNAFYMNEGTGQFYIDFLHNLSVCQTEITKAEYDAELQNFIVSVNKI